jgi:hypothetical protein
MEIEPLTRKQLLRLLSAHFAVGQCRHDDSRGGNDRCRNSPPCNAQNCLPLMLGCAASRIATWPKCDAATRGETRRILGGG